MADFHELARPMMRARASFHADEAGRLLGEERNQLAACEPPSKHSVPGDIHAVNLEDRLGEIKTNRDNGHSGNSLQARSPRSHISRMNGGGPCHQTGRPARSLHHAGKHRPVGDDPIVGCRIAAG